MWPKRVFWIVAALAVSQAHADPVAELDDAASRMQYAFYTEDARAMREALAAAKAIEAPGALENLRTYDLAYGQWKLALLATANGAKIDRSEGAHAADECRSKLDAVLSKNDKDGEVLALRAACERAAQQLGRLRVIAGSSCESDKFLQKALEVAPHNPRVLLVRARCIPDRADKPNPQALDAMRKAVAAFEEHSESRPGQPDWGHAEALRDLGQMVYVRGDRTAARDWLERALVVTPDYVAAQTLLKNVAAAR